MNQSLEKPLRCGKGGEVAAFPPQHGYMKWRGRIASPLGAVGRATIGAIFFLAGCSGDRATWPAPQVTRAQLLEAMTPEAALAVGLDGRLKLGALPNTGRAQISAAQAGALAVALAKYNLPYNREFFDGQHGGPILYQKLSICDEPLYAASAFERLTIDDPANPPHPLQKGVGPFWLVKLCIPGGTPQINIAVSAYATELSIDERGAIVFPAIGGGDFFPEGIPVARRADELPSAEVAVVLAATLTGRRVAAIPDLVAPFFRDDSPLGARWHLRLDRPVRFRSSAGLFIETSELFMSRIRSTNGLGSQIWTADAIQPADVEVTFLPQIRVGENINDYLVRQAAEIRTLRVQRRINVPVRFAASGITP